MTAEVRAHDGRRAPSAGSHGAKSFPPVQTATAEGAERRATVGFTRSFAGRPALHARRLGDDCRSRAPVAGGPQPLAGSVPLRILASPPPKKRLVQNPSRALRRSTARPRPSAGRAACNPGETQAPRKARSRRPGTASSGARRRRRRSSPAWPAGPDTPSCRGRTMEGEHAGGEMSRNKSLYLPFSLLTRSVGREALRAAKA